MPQRAALKPVPHRPAGPVDPADALAHVERQLPDLDEAARQALALVELVGRTRPQLRAETAVTAEELAEAMARARKALRRATFPLPGSGWCERAERLLSDELDGELEEPGPRRLAAHFANCDRCVEHERRLWQARDRLIESFEEARRASPAAAKPERPDTEAPELPEPAEPMLEPPPPVAALEAGPAPELKLVESPAVETPAAETAAAETPLPAPPEPADPFPGDPFPGDPFPTGPEPSEPGPADPFPAEPEPADPLPAAQAHPVVRLTWAALTALAVLLTVVSIALTAYAIAGGGF